jgi:hypothetical protein
MMEKNGRQMGRLMRPSNKITVAFVSPRVDREIDRALFSGRISVAAFVPLARAD